MAKLRPLGEVTQDLEKILQEMTDEDGNGHDLQWGEVLAIIHSWLTIHAAHQQEVYTEGDDSTPEYYYGPKRT